MTTPFVTATLLGGASSLGGAATVMPTFTVVPAGPPAAAAASTTSLKPAAAPKPTPTPTPASSSLAQLPAAPQTAVAKPGLETTTVTHVVLPIDYTKFSEFNLDELFGGSGLEAAAADPSDRRLTGEDPTAPTSDVRAYVEELKRKYGGANAKKLGVKKSAARKRVITSDSDDSDDDDAAMWYDVDDPFVDDSDELYVRQLKTNFELTHRYFLYRGDGLDDYLTLHGGDQVDFANPSPKRKSSSTKDGAAGSTGQAKKPSSKKGAAAAAVGASGGQPRPSAGMAIKPEGAAALSDGTGEKKKKAKKPKPKLLLGLPTSAAPAALAAPAPAPAPAAPPGPTPSAPSGPAPTAATTVQPPATTASGAPVVKKKRKRPTAAPATAPRSPEPAGAIKQEPSTPGSASRGAFAISTLASPTLHPKSPTIGITSTPDSATSTPKAAKPRPPREVPPAIAALVSEIRRTLGEPLQPLAWKPTDGTAGLPSDLVTALCNFAAAVARFPAGYHFSDANVKLIDFLGIGLQRARRLLHAVVLDQSNLEYAQVMTDLRAAVTATFSQHAERMRSTAKTHQAKLAAAATSAAQVAAFVRAEQAAYASGHTDLTAEQVTSALRTQWQAMPAESQASYIAAATKAGQLPEQPEAPAPSGASQPAFDGASSRPATDAQEAGAQSQARRCVSFPWTGAPQQLTIRAMDLAGRIGILRDELADRKAGDKPDGANEERRATAATIRTVIMDACPADLRPVLQSPEALLVWRKSQPAAAPAAAPAAEPKKRPSVPDAGAPAPGGAALSAAGNTAAAAAAAPPAKKRLASGDGGAAKKLKQVPLEALVAGAGAGDAAVPKKKKRPVAPTGDGADAASSAKRARPTPPASEGPQPAVPQTKQESSSSQPALQ